MDFLAPFGLLILGRAEIEVSSLVSLADAQAALVAQDESLTASPGSPNLAVSVCDYTLRARYAVADAPSGQRTGNQMNTFHWQIVGRLTATSSGCTLRGRSVVPYLNIAVIVAAVSVFFAFFPINFGAAESFEHVTEKIWIAAVTYVVLGIPPARTDVPHLERNIRYALTGSNDG